MKGSAKKYMYLYTLLHWDETLVLLKTFLAVMLLSMKDTTLRSSLEATTYMESMHVNFSMTHLGIERFSQAPIFPLRLTRILKHPSFVKN